MRNLKGLQEIITVEVVEDAMKPTKPDVAGDEHVGWWFPEGGDSHFGCKTIRDFYAKHDPEGANTKFTVPILYDRKTKAIVSNESSEIIRMLHEFKAFSSSPEQAALDLYPEEMRGDIDAVNEWVYTHINNGVYKAGFARTQEAYDVAVDALFEHLDKAEAILSTQRYLCGSKLTEADLRLFVTLVRFDEVYVQHFKCTKKRIVDLPNLEAHMRDFYQMTGIAETVVMDSIRAHYYKSHSTINQFAIVPAYPEPPFLERMAVPSTRADKF